VSRVTVSAKRGRVHVIATPIGNLEDLSPRALRLLRESSVIACEDTRRTGRLCAHFEVKTPRMSLHEHNETRRLPALLARLDAGDDVALVCDAGTPLLSDPGARFVEAARASGSRIVPVPGPSAILAALVASGLATRPFTFLGFLPRKGQARRRAMEQLRRLPGTLVLFEAPGRVNQTLRELYDLLGARPVAIARELTKLHEEILRGQLGSLRLEEERGEVTLIVEGGEAEASDRMPDAEVDALIQKLRAEGGSSRDVAREVAEASGRSRSQIYSRLLASDEKP